MNLMTELNGAGQAEEEAQLPWNWASCFWQNPSTQSTGDFPGALGPMESRCPRAATVYGSFNHYRTLPMV